MSQQQSDFIDINGLLRQYASKWYLFVASVIICVGLAYFYARITPTEYLVKANVLISQDNSTPSVPNLGELSSLFGAEGYVDDEIFILSSHSVYREVARDLQLNIAEIVKTGFMKKAMAFPEKPIIVSAPKEMFDTLYTGIGFKIKVDENGKGSVRADFREKKVLDVKDVTFPYVAKTPIGELTLSINPKFPDVAEGFQVNIGISGYDAAAEALDNNVVCEIAARQSNVINMQIVTPNTEYGKAVLNSIITEYNKRGITEKNQQGMQTAQFLNDRIAILANDLNESELEIQNYKQSHNIVDLQTETKYFSEKRARLDGEIMEAETQAEIIKMASDFMKAPGNDYALIPVTVENSGLQKMIEEYNKLVLQYNDISTSAKPGNSSLALLERQISSMRTNLESSMQRAYDQMMVRVNDYRREISTSEERLGSIPSQEREYIDMYRQRQVKNNLYLYLLQRAEETAMVLANATPKGIIIDNAFTNSQPQNMGKKMILLIGFFLGLCIPPVILYLRKIIRNKFETRSDVEKITDVPILGEISTDRSGRNLVVTADSNSTTAELFRLIRANLQFMLNSPEDKVILVTSTRAGEGKSFISVNLAASLALLGKKVLIMGMDIRKPRLADYLNIHPAAGLTQYLSSSDMPLDRLLTDVPGVSGLQAIVAGPVPPNPAELLASKKVDELFRILRERFDYVIVDTAPIGMVSDTFSLDRVADASIYVCRVNYTPASSLSGVNDIYHNNRLKKLSLVINGVSAKKSYGYGSDKE